jgi:hypothetical protein
MSCPGPLAERRSPFVEHRCKRFLRRKPLAERLESFAECPDELEKERCESFVRGKPLAQRLWSFVEHRC